MTDTPNKVGICDTLLIKYYKRKEKTIMADKEQLKDEQTENVTGGGSSFIDDLANFQKGTELLKEAGDRAWAVLGDRNKLWKQINFAEKATSYITRKKEIKKALVELLTQKNFMNDEDYFFIKKKLDKSYELTK